MANYCDLVIDSGWNGRYTKRLTRQQARVTVGRHPSCDIVLTATNVSRNHAEISVNFDTFEVSYTQHGTQNSYFQGIPVGRGNTVPIRPFERVWVVHETFEIYVYFPTPFRSMTLPAIATMSPTSRTERHD